MHLSTLSEWLDWIESNHSKEIDLGLERVKIVAERLNVLSPACPVVIVGGTNGKGSTVFGLEAIYLAANYRTGAFTSPYLFNINEEIRIGGQIVSDQELCEAFAKVEAARAETSLTYFEFCTLAALILFQEHDLDVMILEVGLGGRLDAVNIIDANVAVVTSIGIDHVNFLGHTREQIGSEKAGIFRYEKPVVCGDFDPPNTLIEAAANLNAPFYQQGRDFDYEENKNDWSWTNQVNNYESLPRNSLATQNMSTVLKVISLLQNRLPVTEDAIREGLKNVNLPGRIQIIPGQVTEIYDVAHNPAAIKFLKEKLINIPCNGKTHAVFSMLEDKDIIGSLIQISSVIDHWHVAPLKTKRAATIELLEESFESANITNVTFHPSIEESYTNAINMAEVGDRIIIFGSFHTVADVWKFKAIKP